MPVNLKFLIIWSIIGTGITSVTTQLLTIREFLTQLHGNEITISLVISCWLLLTGVGSLLAKLVKRATEIIYALIGFAIGILPLVQIILIRSLRDLLFTHGVSPGFNQILFYILLNIGPYCLLTGFILPYALRLLKNRQYLFDTGDLYLTDSIGDIAGGVFFSFFLVYWLKPFSIIAVTSSMLLAASLALLLMKKRPFLLVCAICAVGMFFFYAGPSSLERQTLSGQYGNILKYIESPYGRIVVSTEDSQRTVWESGVPLYSDANVISSEEKIHYPLSQLEEVKDVLLISGGLGQTVPELSKYSPDLVTYVELDPYLTKQALRLGAIKEAPFLDIVNTDGRLYIKKTNKKYDAVIMDLPEPDTFQVNRFFTTEFMEMTKRVLKEKGILSMSLEYSPNYIGGIRKEKLSILCSTASLHFKNVLILPGERAYFLCSDRELDTDIPSKLKSKSINTSYVSGYFYGNVSGERIEWLNKTVNSYEEINRDFDPKLVSVMFKEWFVKYDSLPWYFLGGILAFSVIYLIFLRIGEFVLFSTGFVSMGAEMFIIFAFQAIYGYIYQEIGAIVTAFLLGLLPGALLGNRQKSKEKGKVVVSEALLLGLLLLFFFWVSYLGWEVAPFWFLVYAFCFASVCGFQFPVAAGVIGESSSPAAGLLAADLCGAALGAIVTGAVLIPLVGIGPAVLFLIMIKISSTLISLFKGSLSF